MKTSSNKKSSRRNDRKVLVAEESTKIWADSDSDSSSSSSSSSDSEQEEVHCFMADHASDDGVFDFANTEFTREDLVQALNDMVHEYKTLSHIFEEIKAENVSLKNSSAESSSNELENTDSLKTELSRLKIENYLLRNEPSELKAEVDKLTKEMSSWNQSTRSLFKLYESQKPLNDKNGVGFNYDSSHGETSTQSQPVYDKFNERSFVKGGVIHDCIESIRYDDQDTSQLDRKGKGKVGVGYQRLENSKPGWLKNKLNKDKAKAASQIFDLLSDAHSQSMEALLAQQREHGLSMDQPCPSSIVDSSVDSGAVLARFYSIANSTCWVRPVILVNGVWTPVQGPDFWSSSCRLSLFLNKMKMPAPAIQEIVVPHVSFIEPVLYWTAVPWMIRIWQWTKVREEFVQFSVSGGRPGFLRCIYILSISFPFSPAVDSFENDWRLALGPAILSRVEQEEQLYFVQSPESPPAISPHHSSSSSSTDVSMHFDSTDIPVNAQEDTQASASVDFTKFTEALEDLRSSLAQRIHDSNCEILSKINAVELGVRGDLLKVSEHLDFQSKIADILSLSTQVGDIADYLRGGAAKKGEIGSSSRPSTVRTQTQSFPPTTGTFEERVAQARRHIIETGQVVSIEEAVERVIEADRRESDRLERERERERRERRQSRSGTYKRRR
ncbi:hypothetical protein F511_04434 [Dorcoceras hygrometricum]|uniref:Uncharacterized protein n=1 Tax=Dorcoceras hygrometricum TaxID=472368 RepID=A0A2Z7CS07_9LAMI|nr:hypothetical protein F511_04434 [Dorcoceras hygrometricum]